MIWRDAEQLARDGNPQRGGAGRLRCERANRNCAPRGSAGGGGGSGDALPRSRATGRPDLSGYWDFQVNVGDRVTTGEMTLGRSGDAYLGTLTPKGTNTLAVRSLKVAWR
jgi:hypothetical protein